MENMEEAGNPPLFLGALKPSALFVKQNLTKEIDYEYFKPYLTWAAKGRMDGPENTWQTEDVHYFYKYHPSAFNQIITMEAEEPNENFITLLPSVYVKAEYTKE